MTEARLIAGNDPAFLKQGAWYLCCTAAEGQRTIFTWKIDILYRCFNFMSTSQFQAFICQNQETSVGKGCFMEWWRADALQVTSFDMTCMIKLKFKPLQVLWAHREVSDSGCPEILFLIHGFDLCSPNIFLVSYLLHPFWTFTNLHCLNFQVEFVHKKNSPSSLVAVRGSLRMFFFCLDGFRVRIYSHLYMRYCIHV